MNAENMAWTDLFLASLRQSGIVSRAATAAGVTYGKVVSARKQSAEFDAACDDALEEAIDAMEMEARRRAIEGTTEAVYHQGEIVGFQQKYSDGLLQFLLKGRRRAVYGDKQELTGPNGGPVLLDSTSRAARVAQLMELAQERRRRLAAPDQASDSSTTPEDYV